MSNTRVKGESEILHYMAFLADPSTAVNQTAVDRAFKAFEDATDPLKKLEARQAWVDSRQPDPSKLEADFIKVAFEWAERKGIQAETFLAQGVPREVLRDAGFEVRTGVYRPRVKGDTVRKWALDQADKFTIAEAVDALGASPAGVRNVLNSMIEEGTVEVVSKEHGGTPGKPAFVYRTV
jgi:hypothetical protein